MNPDIFSGISEEELEKGLDRLIEDIKKDRARVSRKGGRSMVGGNSGRASFAELLTISLIVLKLCNVIDCSWFGVISPLWVSALLSDILDE